MEVKHAVCLSVCLSSGRLLVRLVQLERVFLVLQSSRPSVHEDPPALLL